MLYIYIVYINIFITNRSDYYSRLWEYLLLISPPEDVKCSIGKIKKEVGIKYGSTHAMYSTAHISLVKFLLVKGYERNLLAQLFSFCINRLSFEVSLKNFDVFPRHTLYINVQENSGLKNLKKGLTFLLFSSASVHEECIKPSKIYYMTIARNLNPAQFESISREYKSRTIDTSFQARNIILLKREYNEYNSKSCRWNGSHNFVLEH